MDIEKLPAACAVDWSIELEKGLRSRKPGQSIESIKKIGQRLVEWNRGPKLTMAVTNMCGLVPGEERLFAEGILLHLSSAFASGDKETRICIAKVFSSAFRHRGKKGRGHGIFSTMSLGSQRELLNRVRVVLDDGDVESRALSLVCFGCLAVIAKDIADVRYEILTRFSSVHALEVKASLFAAGCISELSDDFATVFLEMLINIIATPSTCSVLRLAATRTFAKMAHFPPLANKAYKVGSELLLKYQDEEFVTSMLISLSKLVINSMSLISEQFCLLFSFLNQKITVWMQATALKCIHYIIKRKGCHILITTSSSQNLFSILHEADLPSPLRCEALKIVLKVISYMSPDMLLMHMHELEKLLALAENRTIASLVSERLLEMQTIVNMYRKLNGRMEIVPSGVCSVPVSRITTLLCDRLTEVVKLMLNQHWGFEIEKEVKFLLNLLMCLVKSDPQLACLILDKLGSIIEHIVNEHGMNVDSSIRNEVHVIVQSGECYLEVFMFLMYKFFIGCLERITEAGVASIQVFLRLKYLVSLIRHSCRFNCSIHIIYALLLHSVANWCCILSEACTADVQQNPEGALCNWPEDESLTADCLRNMLAGDKWFAFTVGKYAACSGAWFVGNFIFVKLSLSIQHSIYTCWLRYLAQINYSEWHVQVLFLKEGLCDSRNNILSGEYIEKLVATCEGISLAEKILVENDIPNQMFTFQRWFLALRKKILEVLVDVLKLLGTLPLGQDGLNSSKQHEQTVSVNGSASLEQMSHVQCFLVGISSRLVKIVREYDLMASSFLDMDSKSLKIIASLASSCSLLAFGSGFAYFFPNLPVLEDMASCTSVGSVNCLHLILIRDLVERVSLVDFETCRSLMSCLKFDKLQESCFHLQHRFSISRIGSKSVMITTACRNAIKEVAHLQNEVMVIHNGDESLRLTRKRKEVLLNIIKEWMHIPFQLPKYFFKVRCCMGAFLFSSSVDPKNPSETSILQGLHLALNLCLQLENVPPDLTLQMKKIYCILHCKTSFSIRPHREPSGWKSMDYQAWTTDTMMHMHEKLQMHVVNHIGSSIVDGGSDGDQSVVEACICFETNGARQGFSTCLLDVSAFPVGTYRIQWRSSFIDSQGCYRSLLPLNDGPVFTVAKPRPGL